VRIEWRAIPKDLPPKSTVYGYFDLWAYDGTLDRIHHAALREVSRSDETRSQPDRRRHRQPEHEKRRKSGRCIDPHGYDAGKKIKGKKRHILVDTIGAFCFIESFTAPIFRIAMVAFSSYGHCSANFPFCKSLTPRIPILFTGDSSGMRRLNAFASRRDCFFPNPSRFGGDDRRRHAFVLHCRSSLA